MGDFRIIRAPPLPRSRWERAADVALFALALAACALIFWTMLRLDYRSERLEQLVAARSTPCPCPP
jgi:hypothetical protein